MDKTSEDSREALLMQDHSRLLSPDFRKEVEELLVRQRDFDEAKLGTHSLSAAERQKRQEAVDFARASLGLEGFAVTDECEADAHRFINGEIELDEFLRLGLERIRRG